ncbi:MAG: site-specific DNA-methyltransferase [Thermodesulfobacteriota bacterium]|nr:site-specific DNA-methyltransferase [Thermodesulfobacteriota bacterium]
MENLITKHKVIWTNAAKMTAIPNASIDLVVTSPPYPMIEMWDSILGKQRASIKQALGKRNGMAAFEAMHTLLDKVWAEVFRILKPDRFACINIGDATRTIGSNFALYPNHARILSALIGIGFTPLPDILWRKQTNAPNKFMGSGMLPAGAYVTLEHEYILVVRKGRKREFIKPSEKQLRRESAYFWEERNTWFSDIWLDIKGSRQALGDRKLRKRSAAFPFEIPYRLINMYSTKGDTVLDPFLGTGTTLWAAMAAARNSIGVELDPHFKTEVFTDLVAIQTVANQRIDQRIEAHHQFVKDRLDTGYQFKHTNAHYGFPVMTAQEKELRFDRPVEARSTDSDTVRIDYSQNIKDIKVDYQPHRSANPHQRSLFSAN